MPATLEKRLKELAAAKRVKPSELGTGAEMSDWVVGNWHKKIEAGDPFPGKLEHFVRLAQFWGVSMDWLLGFSDRGGPDEVPSVAKRDDALMDAVAEGLKGCGATRRVAGAAAALAYVEELKQSSAASVERLTALAKGIVDADAAFSQRPSSKPPAASGPTGAPTRHKLGAGGPK